MNHEQATEKQLDYIQKLCKRINDYVAAKRQYVEDAKDGFKRSQANQFFSDNALALHFWQLVVLPEDLNKKEVSLLIDALSKSDTPDSFFYEVSEGKNSEGLLKLVGKNVAVFLLWLDDNLEHYDSAEKAVYDFQRIPKRKWLPKGGLNKYSIFNL